MRIHIAYIGETDDEGARCTFQTSVVVDDDLEAELAGQRFARLVDRIDAGMSNYRGALYDEPGGDP